MWAGSLSWIDGLASAAVPGVCSLSITVTAPRLCLFLPFYAPSLFLFSASFILICTSLSVFTYSTSPSVFPKQAITLLVTQHKHIVHTINKHHANNNFSSFQIWPNLSSPPPLFFLSYPLVSIFFLLLLYSHRLYSSPIDPLRKQLVCLPAAQEEWDWDAFSFIWIQLVYADIMTGIQEVVWGDMLHHIL